MTSARTLMHTSMERRTHTVFEIEISEAEADPGGCQLQCYSRKRLDAALFTVDWGDGTISEYTQNGQFTMWHNFMSAGKYTVRIDAGLSWFRLVEAYVITDTGGKLCRPNVRPIQWGDMVESAQGTYSHWNRWYGDMKGVWGIPPAWGRSMTDVTACYTNSKNITGRIPIWTNAITRLGNCYANTAVYGKIPRWRKGMTQIGGCFDSAMGMYGQPPPWPKDVTNVDYCYRNLTGVTGKVPEWPATVESAQGCFSGCVNLTGKIPKWPENIVWVNETFKGCTGLDGAWSEDPEELMPEPAIRHHDCVKDSSAELSSLFTEEWGGTIKEEES